MKNQTHTSTFQTVVIAGAGPAGLTAAYELLQQTKHKPIVLEATNTIGGISQTVRHNGNRMDIGGHRFFSKSQEIMTWWERLMPVQGAPSKDDILLNSIDKPLAQGGPNPEQDDRVILFRHRVSRIFFLRKFFDYPISMKKDTFFNMGLCRMFRAGIGYLWACVHKLPETSLENFYINRFGRPLYEMFFEGYTEKVWGVHPSKLGADWGSQRVKGLSITAVLKDMFRKAFGTKTEKNVETSLIEQFIYPKYGPGQLWETVAEDVRKMGGEIRMENEVIKVHVKDNQIVAVIIRKPNGITEQIACDYFLSTMPIKDLVCSLEGIEVPLSIRNIAQTLPYRDFITVGLCPQAR